MSIYQLNKLCYRIHHDADFRKRAAADPQSAANDFDLSRPEREALLAGDVARLYRIGVHPFLLSHLARYGLFGLDRARYAERIRTLLLPTETHGPA